jgi:hypothetical protein
MLILKNRDDLRVTYDVIGGHNMSLVSHGPTVGIGEYSASFEYRGKPEVHALELAKRWVDAKVEYEPR